MNTALRTAAAVSARVEAFLGNKKRPPVQQVNQCNCCLKYVSWLSARGWCTPCEKEFRIVFHKIEVAR